MPGLPTAPTTLDQTAHPVDCICQSVSSFHAQTVENLEVSGPRFSERIVRWSKPARRPAGRTRKHLQNDLDMALEYGDSGRAWELARLLANKTARSVKPRPIFPFHETERHEMDAHMKKVFGADRTTNTGNIQDHDPPYQCGPMAEIATLILPLQKRARRLTRFRAVPS